MVKDEWHSFSMKPRENVQVLMSEGLMLDLDADYGIQIEEGKRINTWTNRV